MTYTNAKHVMVMATGFEEAEFTDDTGAPKRFWRAHERGEQVDARKIS